MICWFSGSVTDSFGDLQTLHDGLGFIEASACPHYDGDPRRRPAFHTAVQSGLPIGFAADDGAALHFSGTTFLEAVSSRPNAHAYQVRVDGQNVVETKIPTRYLGDTT